LSKYTGSATRYKQLASGSNEGFPMSGNSATPDPSGRVFYVEGTAIPARPLDPGLYIVATPIGNLGDITLRALATLAAADLIACEDTRVTRILTGRYGISTRLVAYHEHNAERQRPVILKLLGEGKAVALVSDAGTPLISDPGYRLVGEAAAAGYAIVPIPGASAVLAGLVASGLPTDSFHFAGFLPPRSEARRSRLAALARIPATLVFFEAPQRIAAALADMAAILGADRSAVIARELTKAFETIRRGSLQSLAGDFAGEPTPKGEIVVLVGPPRETAHAEADIDAMIAGLLRHHTVKAAVAEASALTGLPRRDIYRRALALKGEADPDED
jgi:16S rRNA (cytidine1402-2'-O)-methyltransferase